MPPGYLLVRDDCEPLPLKATLDRQTEKFAYFLNQVWIYLECHEAAFPDEGTCVNAITVNLEEAAEWIVTVNNEGAPELGNISAFLEGLWARLWDPTQARWAESEIHSIKQGNWSMAEYIQEFCSLAGKLRVWPKRRNFEIG